MSAAEDMGERWNKAQRLHVAGALAPHLRDQDDRVKSRRVARVDADGKVVGWTTLGEVQKSLLLAREIELEVQPDVRPKDVLCQRCGRTVRVPKFGAVPTTCRGDLCRQPRCAGFGPTEGDCAAKPARQAFTPKQIKRRNGAPWRCRTCSAAERMARPGKREAAANHLRKVNSTPEAKAARSARMKGLDKAEFQRRAKKAKENPEYKERFMKQRRSPEFREAQAERAREHWKARRRSSPSEGPAK